MNYKREKLNANSTYIHDDSSDSNHMEGESDGWNRHEKQITDTGLIYLRHTD